MSKQDIFNLNFRGKWTSLSDMSLSHGHPSRKSISFEKNWELKKNEQSKLMKLVSEVNSSDKSWPGLGTVIIIIKKLNLLFCLHQNGKSESLRIFLMYKHSQTPKCKKNV